MVPDKAEKCTQSEKDKCLQSNKLNAGVKEVQQMV